MTEQTFKVGDKVKHNIRGTVEVAYGPYTDTFGRTQSVIRLESGRETAVPVTTLTALPVLPTFLAGDKVSHRTFGPCEIAFGPFLSSAGPDRYLMVDADGQHMSVSGEAMTIVPAAPEPVKVGDRVRVLVDRANCADVKAGDVFTVGSLRTLSRTGIRTTAVPRRSDGWYFSMNNVEKVDALEPIKVDALEPVKVGDRVAVVVDDPNCLPGEFVDLLGRVIKIGGNTFSTPVRYQVKFESHAAKYVTWWCNEVRKVAAQVDGFTYKGATYEYGVKYSDRDGDDYEFKSELSGPGTRDHNDDGTPIGRMLGRRDGEPGSWQWTLAEVVDGYGPLTRV